MHAIDIFCRSDLNGTNLTGKGLIDDVKGVRSEGSSNYFTRGLLSISGEGNKRPVLVYNKISQQEPWPRIIRLVYNNVQTP